MGLPYADPTNTGQWAHDLLASLGDPQTASNVGYIEAWEAHESPSGYGYNPLGTEETAPGSVHAPGNTATVQAFQSWLSGLQATVATFNGDPANATLEQQLASGDASLAQLSAAQSVPGSSWATGGEKAIASLGSSTPFTYGGAQGLVEGAPGVATDPTSAGNHSWFGSILTLGGHLPGGGVITDVTNAPESIAKKLASSVFGPLVSWIEDGAADVTFIGFGMLLIVIGLVVTFKGGSSSQINLSTIAPSSPPTGSSKTGGLEETGGDVADVAEVAAA